MAVVVREGWFSTTSVPKPGQLCFNMTSEVSSHKQNVVSQTNCIVMALSFLQAYVSSLPDSFFFLFSRDFLQTFISWYAVNV